MNRHVEDSGRRPPSGSLAEIIRVAWPIVVSMLSYTFMGVADTLMVARLGTDEVAAVGLAVTGTFTVSAFCWGILNGVKVVVAQAHGAGRSARTRQAALQSVVLAAAAGVILLGLLPLGDSILGWIGARGRVHELGSSYFAIRLLGIVPMYLSIAAFGYFQGLGDTRTPMRIQVFANALNIGLDVVLIFGLGPIPAFGVQGAAIATVIAFTVQGVLALRVLLPRVWPDRHRVRDLAGFREIIRLGLPMGLRFGLEVASWAVFTGFLARMGDVHVAAHIITIRIISVSFLPGHGIGEAACVLTGQAVGAQEMPLARVIARRAMIICVTVMGACGVVFWLWHGQILGLFDPEPAVAQLGGSLMLLAAAFQIFDGVAMVMMGALNGAGDTRFVMYANVLSSWFLLVPLGYLLCNQLGWGAPGAWVALTAQIILLAGVLSLRWRRVTNPEPARRVVAQVQPA